MLLGTLGASLFGNLLEEKGIVRAGSGNKKEKELKQVVLENNGMPPHPLTDIEILRYYQNEPIFNDVFSRNNLPKTIKDGAYLIILDEYADVGTHWIALFCNRNDIFYFNSFGAEHVTEEIKEFAGNKNIIANTFRVQANN